MVCVIRPSTPHACYDELFSFGGYVRFITRIGGTNRIIGECSEGLYLDLLGCFDVLDPWDGNAAFWNLNNPYISPSQ